MQPLQIMTQYKVNNTTLVNSTTKYTEPIVVVGGQTPGIQIDQERNFSPGVFHGFQASGVGYSMQ